MATLKHAGKGREVTVPDDAVDYYLERGWHVAGTEPVEVVEIPDGDPSEDWSRKQLDAYAEGRSIDLAGAKTKGDVVALITAAKQEGEPGGTDAAEGGTVPADADGGAGNEG